VKILDSSYLQGKLLVLTSIRNREKEGKLINQLFQEGLDYLHLRKPGKSSKQISKFIETINPAFHKKIIIHHQHHLYHSYDLGGVHVNHQLKKRKFFMKNNLKHFRKLAPETILSTSCKHLKNIKNKANFYSYILYNPVFHSTKNYENTIINKDLLKEFLIISNQNIVALGGINSQNIHLLKEIGFTAAALHTAIWKHNDPLAEFIKIRKIWDNNIFSF
jgi:thiamine-phosphate pyrophosphorylase